MNVATVASGSRTTALELPRVSQLEFLRMFVRGLRGDFSPWREAVKRYPQGIESRIARQRCLLMNEPAGIEELLVRNHKYYHRRTRSTPLKVFTGQSVLTSGEAHLRQRRLIQPAFQKSRIDAYGDAMAALGEKFSARWRDGDTVDIHAEMMEVTAAIITQTMFSSSIEEDIRIVGHAIDYLLTHAKRYVIPVLGNVLDRLPLKSTKHIGECRAA